MSDAFDRFKVIKEGDELLTMSVHPKANMLQIICSRIITLIVLLIAGLITLYFVNRGIGFNFVNIVCGCMATVVTVSFFQYLAFKKSIYFRILYGVLCVICIYSLTFVFQILMYNGLLGMFSIIDSVCLSAFVISLFSIVLFYPFSISILIMFIFGDKMYNALFRR